MVWIIYFRAFCVYFLLITSSRSFIGYSNINSVLSEVRDPVRTIRLAAPLGMISVAVVYFFINISYFAVVSKRDILESQRIVALVIEAYCFVIPFIQLSYRALYFRNLFGPTTERVGFSLHTTSSFVEAIHAIGPQRLHCTINSGQHFYYPVFPWPRWLID